MEVRQKDSSHREVQVLTVSLNSSTWFFMPHPHMFFNYNQQISVQAWLAKSKHSPILLLVQLFHRKYGLHHQRDFAVREICNSKALTSVAHQTEEGLLY